MPLDLPMTASLAVMLMPLSGSAIADLRRNAVITSSSDGGTRDADSATSGIGGSDRSLCL